MEIDEFIKEVKELLRPAHLSSVRIQIQMSKFVGFFHPRVRVNETVKSKQILATIRVAGMENKIESETAGIVVRIFVDDGQPIEYGESLFEIQPL